MASCKDGGKVVKVLKGNTTNLMSHLRTKHPKIQGEMRQKLMERSVFVNNSSRPRSLTTSNRLHYLVAVAASKVKLQEE